MSDRTTPDFASALADPAAAFSSPEAVLAAAGLTAAQKTEILRRWEYDASEADVALEEGMPGRDDGLLRRILLALEKLAEVDVGHTAPTKQDGLPRGSARPK